MTSYSLTGIEFQFCKMNRVLEMGVMLPRRALMHTRHMLQGLKWKISLCVFYHNKRNVMDATFHLKCRDIQIR